MTPIQQAIAILEEDALTNRIERALEVLRGVPQSPQQPQTLAGMIAAIYGYLDAEDCALIDREWARQRAFVLPTDGTCTLTRPQHGAEEKVARIKAIGDEAAAVLSDTRPVRPAACEHDWKIWPETNGQSQRCMKCGVYRDTPDSSHEGNTQ